MSICISKILLNRRTFGLLNKCCLLTQSKLISQVVQENIGSRVEVLRDISQFFNVKDRECCRQFIDSQTSLPVQWENLEKDLMAMETTNIRSTILRSCEVLQKGDLAIDYYQYLFNKNEKISILETCLLIKVLNKLKFDAPKYDKLIKTLFDHSHNTIFDIELVVSQAVDFFSQNETCFKEILLKYDKGELNKAAIEMLIVRLFDVNEAELAWKILNENPEKFTHLVIESFMKFCFRLAKENKFTTNIFDDFINFTRKHSIVIKMNNIYESISELTNILNKSEMESYKWSVDRCDMVNATLCSSCQYNLKPESVTKEELAELKTNFLEKVIICRNINMKTTPTELQNFLNFLNTCQPYDIVIDFLNLMSGTPQKRGFGRKILSSFESQGLRMLLISRNHFKYNNLYHHLKKKCQIFLTRNDSLDDLFCLYAAMHQGPNTFFCSADFLRDHAKFFSDFRLNALFHKWQISHQYLIDSYSRRLINPRNHSDMSQTTVILGEDNKVQEYRWHLSYLNASQNYRIYSPAQWICLRAKLKTSEGAN